MLALSILKCQNTRCDSMWCARAMSEIFMQLFVSPRSRSRCLAKRTNGILIISFWFGKGAWGRLITITNEQLPSTYSCLVRWSLQTTRCTICLAKLASSWTTRSHYLNMTHQCITPPEEGTSNYQSICFNEKNVYLLFACAELTPLSNNLVLNVKSILHSVVHLLLVLPSWPNNKLTRSLAQDNESSKEYRVSTIVSSMILWMNIVKWKEQTVR